MALRGMPVCGGISPKYLLLIEIRYERQILQGLAYEMPIDFSIKVSPVG
jgi:hypothetical protein